jgi:staphyloferrin B biosynthesis citrate synthase
MIARTLSSTRFRERLAAREPMLGTFVKLPSSQAIEILGAEGFDFVVIDAEHAPLDRTQIDLMILTARAIGMAPIVRVGSPDQILGALDCGADGVMVPHVRSVGDAETISAACRYAGGSRGFAGLTRAGSWGGRKSVEHMDYQDANVVCIAMIEDLEAVEIVQDIVAVDGIHAVFVGRGDLTASFGRDPDAATKVSAMSEKVGKAAAGANKPLLMLATGAKDAADMRSLGVAALLVSSDHAMLKSAAAGLRKEYSIDA